MRKTPRNQSQTISTTIGGLCDDNFVFQPGIGADTIVNFNPQQDSIELDHFANANNYNRLSPAMPTVMQ